MSERPIRRLTSIPGYRLYLAARIAAWIGNVMSLVALPVLVYQLTGSATLTWSHVRPGRPERGGLLADVAEGLRFVWDHRVIRVLTLVGIGHAVTGGAVSALLVVIGVELFGLADDDGRLGVLYMAASVGSLVGSVLVPRLQRRLRVGTITLGGLAVTGGLVVALALTTDWTVGVAVLALLNAAMMTVILNAIMVRQTLTPMRLQSRVNTTARMISWGGSPAGAALGGLVAGAGGIQLALLVWGIGVPAGLLAGVGMGASRIDRLDRLTPVDD